MITQRLKIEKDQSGNKTGNIQKDDNSQFVAWGHNYFRPRGQLLEDLWSDSFAYIETDMQNTQPNSNIIRICLQINKFMNNLSTPNSSQFDKLVQFLNLAAQYDFYVIITGANTWKISDQPIWLSELSENDRWLVQSNFWKEIARRTNGHPAVAWYNLINKPVDQDANFAISNFVTNDDATIDFTFDIVDVYSTNIPSKLGESGYALISNGNYGNGTQKIAYLKYSDLYFDTNYDEAGETIIDYTVYLLGCSKQQFGSYDPSSLDATNYGQSYISFIDKLADISSLQVSDIIGSPSNIATIDLNSADQFDTFQTSQSSNKTIAGFVGSNYTAALKDVTNPTGGGDDFGTTNLAGLTYLSSRYTKGLSSSLGLTENNHGVYGSNLNDDGAINTIPLGYGQVLHPYNVAASQYYASTYYNANRINFVNFGINDFLSYGAPNGYNSEFFIQTLRVVLSRLRASYVSEFTTSNFSGSTQISKISASGGSYQRTTTNQTVTFSTDYSFAGGTIAVGFMVENNADASAQITLNDRTYYQGLKSGIDTLSSVVAPVVKRIHNVPAGANTFTINLTVNSGSACLDYWQIESSSPPPIIVNSIIDYEKFATISSGSTTYSITNSVGTTSCNIGSISKWNTAIKDLIFGEFFDNTVFMFDSTSVVLSSSLFSNKFDLNDFGHAFIASGILTVSNYRNLLSSNIIVNGNQYTYVTNNDHNLQIDDIVVIKGASPSALNGAFKVTSIGGPNTFSVVGTTSVTNPSLSSASYAKCLLQPNKPYFISSGTYIPASSNVLFLTDGIAGSSKVTSSGRYNISLSNGSGITTHGPLENCLITSPFTWVNTNNYFDRTAGVFYSTYLTFTPNGRSSEAVATAWINAMKSAIRTYDVDTPISISTTYVDADGGSGSGFGFNNIQSLVDIISPHQYVVDSVPNAIAGIIKCASLNHPVVLEEGAVPNSDVNLDSSTAVSEPVVSNYVLRSKKYLSGALGDYRVTSGADSNFNIIADLKNWMNENEGTSYTDPIISHQYVLNNKPSAIVPYCLTPASDPIIGITSISESASAGSVVAGTYQYSVSALLSDGTETLLYPADSDSTITTSSSKNITLDWSVNPTLTSGTSNTVQGYYVYKYKSINSGGSKYSGYWRIGGTTDTAFTDQGAIYYGQISSSDNNPLWNANVAYRPGDYAQYDGSNYKVKSTAPTTGIPTQGNPPPTNSYWSATTTSLVGITDTSATLRLSSSSAMLYADLPSTGTVIVNSETIKYGGKQTGSSGSYLINLTRGSSPQTTADGVAVYSVPRLIDFNFVENSPSSNRFGIKLDASYVSEMSNGFTYLNKIAPSSSNIDLNLNSKRIGLNQQLGGGQLFLNSLITNSNKSNITQATTGSGSRYQTWVFDFSNSNAGVNGSDLYQFNVNVSLPSNDTTTNNTVAISSNDTSGANGQGFFNYLTLKYRGLYRSQSTYGNYTQGDLVYYKNTSTSNNGPYDGIYKIWAPGVAITSTTGGAGLTSAGSAANGYVSHTCSGTAVTAGTQTLTVSTTSDLTVGMLITGNSALPDGTTITKINSSTSVNLGKYLTADIDAKVLNFRGWTTYQASPTITSNKLNLIIPMSTSSGVWETDTGIFNATLSNSNYWYPNNWKLSVYNDAANVSPNASSGFISNIQIKYGNTNTSGTEVLRGQVKGSQISSTAVNLSLLNTGISSGNDCTFSSQTLDNLKLSFTANDNTSYIALNNKNLRIINPYLQVNISETLATKGTPSATIV
jgi:hypothetical protein